MDPQPLVTILRAWLNGDAVRTSLPNGVTHLAGQHRLNGTLYHIGAELSESDAAKAEESWSRNLAGHLSRSAALESIWADLEPRPLVFKGADLAENLYDDPGARAANDLDLLLPEPAHTAVLDSLRHTVTRRPPPRGERFVDEPPYAVGFECEGLLIELHRDPQPPHLAKLTGEMIYDRGTEGRLGELQVRFPTRQDRLLLWLTNQAKGAFFCDLAAWLDLCLILRDLTALDLEAHHRTLRQSARTVGLVNAYDLALFRLDASGLWPGTMPRIRRPGLLAINALLPPILGPIGAPPTAKLQCVKTWVCTARARVGLLRRAAATLARGDRPGRGRKD